MPYNYRADLGVTLVSGDASVWANQGTADGGNLGQSNASIRPTLAAGDGDGDTDALAFALADYMTATIAIPAGAQLGVMAVIELPYNATNQRWVSLGSTTVFPHTVFFAQRSIGSNPLYGIHWNHPDPAGSVSVEYTPAPSGYHLWRGQHDQGAETITGWLDESVFDSDVRDASPDPCHNLTIGANSDFANLAVVNVVEIGILIEPPSAGELSAALDYLNERHGWSL